MPVDPLLESAADAKEVGVVDFCSEEAAGEEVEVEALGDDAAGLESAPVLGAELEEAALLLLSPLLLLPLLLLMLLPLPLTPLPPILLLLLVAEEVEVVVGLEALLELLLLEEVDVTLTDIAPSSTDAATDIATVSLFSATDAHTLEDILLCTLDIIDELPPPLPRLSTEAFLLILLVLTLLESTIPRLPKLYIFC